MTMKNKLNIMLIAPPVTRPEDFSAEKVRISPFLPLGLAYLAGYLEKSCEIQILDALIEGDLNGRGYPGGRIRYGLSDEEIGARIAAFGPDVVGVSCIFSAMEWDALKVMRIAKKVNSRIVTVIGGAHAGANGRSIMEKEKMCDYAVIGEGEVSFSEIVRHVTSAAPLQEIDGIMYRENDRIAIQPKTRYIEDLDSIPFPARHLLPMEKYLAQGSAHSYFKEKPFTQIITSRGCPARCTFCALGKHWGALQRKRSPENVLDEMEMLITTYGIREIHFEDDNFTADKERALKIFDGMRERKFAVNWTVPTGMSVYSLDEELLVRMKESGCYSVSLAIENASQDVLTHLMRKPVNIKKVKPLVKKIRELSMDVRGFFILGFPGETQQHIRDTIRYARELELDWAYFFIFAPLPGTEIYETCIKKGYMKEQDFDPLRSFHNPVVKTPEFDEHFLNEIREEAIVEVNFQNNPNLITYDVTKAIRDFQHVVSVYPHFDFAHFYLGEAYLKKGEREKALEQYSRTLELNPQHQKARERREEVSQGRISC
jgi:anaerobic magnesium-protoporphyrin IX monomethyl ester cyclase